MTNFDLIVASFLIFLAYALGIWEGIDWRDDLE